MILMKISTENVLLKCVSDKKYIDTLKIPEGIISIADGAFAKIEVGRLILPTSFINNIKI